MRLSKSVNRITSSPIGHITNGRVLNCTLTRGQHYNTSYPVTLSLPDSVDLEPEMIPCRDQGDEGSCTSFGHGGNADWRQIQAKKGETNSNPAMIFHDDEFVSASCNFFYGRERLIDGDFGLDGGSLVETGITVATKVGFVSEKVFGYDNSLFRMATPEELDWASRHKMTLAQPVDLTDKESVMSALADRNPVVFGWIVYASIQEVGGDGMIKNPGYWFDKPEGGHCSVLFGYKIVDGKVWFKVRNSWGTSWGANGYGWMSEDYLCNDKYTSDGWVAK